MVNFPYYDENTRHTQWKSGIKLLSSRFQQLWGPVNTFTAEGISETGPFIHLSNHTFQKYLSYEAIFFFHTGVETLESSHSCKRQDQFFLSMINKAMDQLITFES